MDAEKYLLEIPLWTKKKNTLADVRAFLKELGSPEEGLRVIHVAGTNGKGSVCADMAEILHCAGYHVGAFISPHLVEPRERFLLDGRMASEAEFEEAFDRVLAAIGRMETRGYAHPSFFEFCFLIAMAVFSKQKVDYCILETGLGGRLDATNSIRKPQLCVITSISLDHREQLGDTVPEIAAEKAGIIKEGVPVVYDDNEPEASEVICAYADRLHAPAYAVAEDGILRKPPDRGALGISREELFEIIGQAPFLAPYQRMDAALALQALWVAGIPGLDSGACIKGLKNVRWQGRMERLAPGVYLDGAHNPGAIRAFVRAVKEQEAEWRGQNGKLHLLFAVFADKDYREMIRLLCAGLAIHRVTVARLCGARSADPGELAALFCQGGCGEAVKYEDAGEAFDAALLQKNEEDRLYVAGSLYLIGEIKRHLRRKTND